MERIYACKTYLTVDGGQISNIGHLASIVLKNFDDISKWLHTIEW